MGGSDWLADGRAEQFDARDAGAADEFDVVEVVGDAGAEGVDVVGIGLGLGRVVSPAVTGEVTPSLAAAEHADSGWKLGCQAGSARRKRPFHSNEQKLVHGSGGCKGGVVAGFDI